MEELLSFVSMLPPTVGLFKTFKVTQQEKKRAIMVHLPPWCNLNLSFQRLIRKAKRQRCLHLCFAWFCSLGVFSEISWLLPSDPGFLSRASFQNKGLDGGFTLNIRIQT